MDIVILILFIVGVVSVAFSWAKGSLVCPPPKIIYRLVPKNTLDLQFGQENLPSEVHEGMFTKGNVWVGGYQLDSGRTLQPKAPGDLPREA